MDTDKKLKLVIDKFYELNKDTAILIEKNTIKRSHLQNYFYFAYFPIFTFTESIIILCNEGKFHSAGVLLRSLIEAHINIIYHQVADTERRLAISAKSGFDQKLLVLGEIKNLISKYPNLKSKDPSKLFSEEYLTKSIEWAKTTRKGIMNGNNLQEKDNDINLQQKAMACEKADVKNAEQGHFERIYTMQYRYLSPLQHLDIEGLQMFVNEDQNGKFLFKDGKDTDGKLYVTTAIDICVALAKDLYENNVIEGKQSEIIGEIDELLKSINID